jgi:hypothetical protein
MIDRNEMAQEILLRKNVSKAIKIVLERRGAREAERTEGERALRGIVRELLEGQSAVASVAKHDSTGINALEDLLKNTNVLSVLETGYKSLTTDKNQRESYKNHILSAIQKSLAPEESRKEAGEDVEITEEIDIGITDRPEDDPDFINVNDDDKEEEPEPPDEREEFGLDGADKTGRNRAFTDFQDIEKVVLTAYDDLDNPEDITMFEEYLLKNIALYFEKYEGELQTNVPEPEIAASAVADADADVPDGVDAVTDTPEFELQEVIKYLNIDDIIENLL